ncbi:hypothetical protein BDM02DRAFT_3117605 [Thelephora ganbajun]|uniref:Uncharacterized protein n=1 Tax=Thelephora ganbajun TaxID=370292 RepID=A0ACB6ZBQ8_THEGA|nr:hypothetical protein BDM02DRAFT_3117605 [Thelephora ganbajun]
MSLSFHDAKSPEFIDVALASVSVKNLSRYFQITAHIWLGDAEEHVLGSKEGDFGLAVIINDGLPRWRRSGGGGRCEGDHIRQKHGSREEQVHP